MILLYEVVRSCASSNFSWLSQFSHFYCRAFTEQTNQEYIEASFTFSDITNLTYLSSLHHNFDGQP